MLWKYTFSLFRRLRAQGACCGRGECRHGDAERFRYAAGVTGLGERRARALAYACFGNDTSPTRRHAASGGTGEQERNANRPESIET